MGVWDLLDFSAFAKVWRYGSIAYMILTIHTDGAARGNPGQAGAGAVIEVQSEKSASGGKVQRYRLKSYLGVATNNRAEYRAVLFALEKAHALIKEHNLEVERIVCYSDSELMVKQLTGKYKVKDSELAQLFVKVWNISQKLPKIEYKHIARAQNKEADRLANEAIDKHAPIV